MSVVHFCRRRQNAREDEISTGDHGVDQDESHAYPVCPVSPVDKCLFLITPADDAKRLTDRSFVANIRALIPEPPS
jgi:hypothetical protein